MDDRVEAAVVFLAIELAKAHAHIRKLESDRDKMLPDFEFARKLLVQKDQIIADLRAGK
jgi:hypothetical protein